MGDYWNHNTAYHRWIIGIAARRGHRDVLDVGCGDGLLLQRLAPLASTVTGIEPDAATRNRARTRLAGVRDATVDASEFAAFESGAARFDLITFVATLHHLRLREALTSARELLRPGGDLLVVGLAANRTVADWVLSGLALPWVKLGSLLHGETRDIGVPLAVPREDLREIRDAARAALPGARVRRGLYYRYLLRWTKPVA